MQALSAAIERTFSWKTKMPEHGETVELGERAAADSHPLQ